MQSAAFEPSSHYYYFSAVLLLITVAVSFVSASVFYAFQNLSGKLEWARARLDEIDDGSLGDLERLEQQARSESEAVFAATVDQAVAKVKPSLNQQSIRWAKDAGRIYREAGPEQQALFCQLCWLGGPTTIGVLLSLVDFVVAKQIADRTSCSVLFFAVGLLLLIWAYRECACVMWYAIKGPLKLPATTPWFCRRLPKGC